MIRFISRQPEKHHVEVREEEKNPTKKHLFSFCREAGWSCQARPVGQMYGPRFLDNIPRFLVSFFSLGRTFFDMPHAIDDLDVCFLSWDYAGAPAIWPPLVPCKFTR
ncbi:hypothetical protein GWI33_019649 [Rhynchophorus ferrugineus]|uniref:Uncharacterized protein n=1 Tax=Rhynchophorus ferrugineus TaxID=354439 RepID=A0A834M0B2_RHYFE|nr:hypothetical protein GWI33_019649 [Rhynchophorus ferrugineus]